MGLSVLRVLSERGCGRATAYEKSNKIVTIGDKTHVSWLDTEKGKFLVKIQTLDRGTGEWSAVYTVGQAFDNHGGPALTCDNSGYLHIVYYPHHHPFRYRRSVRTNMSNYPNHHLLKSFPYPYWSHASADGLKVPVG